MRCQPNDAFRDLFRIAWSLERQTLQVTADPLAGKYVQHGRLDGARADGVDSDKVPAIFHPVGLCEADDGVLGGTVRNEIGLPLTSSHGRDVDNGTTALVLAVWRLQGVLFLHLEDLVLLTEPRTASVYLEKLIPGLGGRCGSLAENAESRYIASVVDATKLLNRSVNHGSDRVLGGDIWTCSVLKP